VQGHDVYFAERDAEPAGERNSASDRAKCGCGVGWGALLELVSGSVSTYPCSRLNTKMHK
jgi:hypothetical protein